MKLRFLVLITLIYSYSSNLCSQTYLDEDQRILKLTEVSNDKTYGFKFKNPIKIGKEENILGAYLNALISPTRSKIHIADIGFQKSVQVVTLSFEDNSSLKKLYFSTKIYDNPKAPKGFSYKKISDIPNIIKFPQEKVFKVQPCNDKKNYAVDQFLLKEKIGDLPKPDIAPVFDGGIDELKKYFTENPLKDEKAENMIFRVAIGFMVNCEGEAGNFQIITKGRGELKTYANQVLEVVNSMPQKWKAGKVGDKSIDAYQVLSFTVINGQLDKVSYRD